MENMLGDKIKRLRKDKGLTQKQLSELARISEIAVKKYENNILNPKYSTLEKLAAALDVSIFEFLNSEEQIREQFEEHFNIPQEINTTLEIKTMLNTTDKKLAISSMLHNFKCFNNIIPDNITDEDLDLLSESIANNIISVIDTFKNISLSLQKNNFNLKSENELLKEEIKSLNNKLLILEYGNEIDSDSSDSDKARERIIYEPFKTLEEQEAFEKSLEDEIENYYSDKEDS